MFTDNTEQQKRLVVKLVNCGHLPLIYNGELEHLEQRWPLVAGSNHLLMLVSSARAVGWFNINMIDF